MPRSLDGPHTCFRFRCQICHRGIFVEPPDENDNLEREPITRFDREGRRLHFHRNCFDLESTISYVARNCPFENNPIRDEPDEP